MTQITEVDTLVVGAGVIGSALAWQLAEQGSPSVHVIDVDLEGALSSSELNAGGVRATWLEQVNFEAARASIEFFSQVSDEVGYSACGYLWLHTPKTAQKAVEVAQKQRTMGWPIELLSVKQLETQFPFIDKTDDLEVAIRAPRDGLINPNLLKNYYRKQAQKKGVQFHDRSWLQSAQTSSFGPVQILVGQFQAGLSRDLVRDLLCEVSTETSDAKWKTFRAKRVVNCAGAWAPRVARKLGYVCSSQPYRRQISLFDCREVDLRPYGMIVDSSGVYFHSESTHVLAGFATQEEPGERFDYDGEEFFMEYIWAPLYERSTKFEKLKHISGWAGLYEVSPDHCAIVGDVSGQQIPQRDQIFEAHSFSGHGVMQSYAVGKGLAERILQGAYQSVDLTPLSDSRFEAQQLLSEKLVI